MSGAQATWLPEGRLHLHHGPIDLILQGWGDPAALRAGYAAAVARFETILAELASELPALRSEVAPLSGPVARVMAGAVAPFRPEFITPMAAVAGAVAQTILGAFVRDGISRAYANNGGDIALHLAAGERLTCAVAGSETRITVHAADPVRGIATSGWRGRSWSLGIADSVTVLAGTAAQADAAATMIANAVDLPGHPAITRRPACELQADSDLGHRPVTVAVGPLTRSDIETALARGAATAQAFRARGLIEACAITLAHDTRTLGPLRLKEPELA
ncbi:MAG: hypothetical protein RIR62_528 [Pseudomonadota bacterium]|jgi:ApbE superfamily uncharacterized protein (UPF0280 family)